MDHCVHAYRRAAARGDSFLFHVEHRGASATVEVDATGRVVQALGPRNTHNAACVRGTSLLAEWGRGFPARPALHAAPVAML